MGIQVMVQLAQADSDGSNLTQQMVAVVLNWLCTTPLEVLSTLNQTTPGNLGLYGCALMLYSQGGLGELYRGLPISCALAINPAIMMLLIHKQQDLLTWLRIRMGEDSKEARKHSPMVMFYTTAIAKIIATVLTYPFIRAKVLIQVHGGGLSDVPRMLAMIVRDDGYGGLFKGIVAMTWKTVLHNSLMMSLKHFLSPLKPMTPASTPKIEPIANTFRSVAPVEAIADKLDELMETIGSASLEKFKNIEQRTELVEQQVNTVREDIRGLGSDIRQIKELIEAMQPGKAKGAK